MKGFLLVLLHMGVVKTQALTDYWASDPFISSPFAGTILSKKRFLLILRAFHLCDNENYLHPDNPNHDPLFKINKILSSLENHVSGSLYARKESRNR